MNIDNRWLSRIALIAVGVLIGILAGGIVLLTSKPPRGEPIVLLPPPTPQPILVHISGSVNQPDVYELDPDSRVRDAISAAGGLGDQANPDSINLAALLSDGDRIYIPFLPATPEVVLFSQPGNNSYNDIEIVAESYSSFININFASQEELEELPGIGPVKAKAIIDQRNKQGGYTKIEDIMDVPGIGQKTFDAIKDLITVEGYYE